jgi:uncharacterized membrane protein YeaQ/YmgE (transglycosylase-associated protein family)
MIVLGIVGGLLGGYVAANVLHVGSVDAINLQSILIATVGSIAVLIVVHLATGGRSLRRSLG